MLEREIRRSVMLVVAAVGNFDGRDLRPPALLPGGDARRQPARGGRLRLHQADRLFWPSGRRPGAWRERALTSAYSNSFSDRSGTSVAAAITAGRASLLEAAAHRAGRHLTPGELRMLLLTSSSQGFYSGTEDRAVELLARHPRPRQCPRSPRRPRKSAQRSRLPADQAFLNPAGEEERNAALCQAEEPPRDTTWQARSTRRRQGVSCAGRYRRIGMEKIQAAVNAGLQSEDLGPHSVNLRAECLDLESKVSRERQSGKLAEVVAYPGKRDNSIPDVRPHDLRRTARAARLDARRFDEIGEVLLNHSKKGVTAVYNRNPYEKEKREALIASGGQDNDTDA